MKLDLKQIWLCGIIMILMFLMLLYSMNCTSDFYHFKENVEETSKGTEYLLDQLGIYEYKNYSMLPKDLPQDIEILIIVITRSESPNLRKLFRHIYGNAYNTDVNSFNLTFKYKLMFLFAIDDLATFIEEKNIIIENEKHQDMIIPMTEDSYKTVSMKLLSSFYWVSLLKTSKLKWIVKIDDDVLLNVQRLDELMKSTQPNEIYCRARPGRKVMRSKILKWSISKMEYIWNEFPTFCVGFFYLMSKNTAIQLLTKFEEAPRQNYIWIEDVYLTGILPSLLDIPRINIDNDEYGQAIIEITKVNFNNYLAGFSHNLSYDGILELWNYHFVEHSCINKNSKDCLS